MHQACGLSKIIFNPLIPPVSGPVEARLSTVAPRDFHKVFHKVLRLLVETCLPWHPAATKQDARGLHDRAGRVRMADSEIDFERVITDPIYRRQVIEQLKAEASGDVRREVARSIEARHGRSDSAT